MPQMSILLQAVTVAGLANSLGNSKTEWTILAPTNDAFVDLLEALNMTAEELLKNKDTLTKVSRLAKNSLTATPYAKFKYASIGDLPLGA